MGRRLLQHLARLAVERGCGRFEWWVLNWNAPAIGFYQMLGALPMSDWTVYRLTGSALEALAEREEKQPRINANERELPVDELL